MQKKQAKRWIRFLIALAVGTASVISFQMAAGVGATGTGWTTSGTKILNPANQQFIITGINWYGFETTGYVAHGLYAQDYPYIINEIKQYGYNTIRIPFSNQMWEKDPIPNPNTVSASPSSQGTHSRDILANIINYAGSIGLHVILDNHRSEAGNSAEANGLWYSVTKGNNYPEQSWINDWVQIQQWVHGKQQTAGATDTVTVHYLASDGYPIVLGYDLRNEPHTPSRTAYLKGATWGTGDGIDPKTNPNPNPFAVTADPSNRHDWRLAAERAADTILGDAVNNGWDYPLIFVEGISQYPTATGTASNGPYDYYWWGGDLQGVNGNANNPGAPIVLNAGGNSSSIGQPVYNQLVYSAHDYGPSVYKQGWFNSSTTYSSLTGIWTKFWGFTNLPNGIAPVSNNANPYPWGNTGHTTTYSQAPVYLGEFGTGNKSTDLYSSGPGSEGQWFTDIVNFVKASYDTASTTYTSLNWTYWALNTEDSLALLGTGYTGLANPDKQHSFLSWIEKGPFILPPTGQLPNPQ